jgi:hypothetical protein
MRAHRPAALALRAVLLAAMSALASCSLGYLNPNFLLTGEARERVEEAAIRYNNSLRFGNLEMAVQWVKPDMRRSFLELFGEQAQAPIRFTDVEIQSIEFGPARGEARILLHARLYRLPSVHEVALLDEQQWHYDPDATAWYITPDLERYANLGKPKTSSAADPSSGPPSPR